MAAIVGVWGDRNQSEKRRLAPSDMRSLLSWVLLAIVPFVVTARRSDSEYFLCFLEDTG